MATSNIEKQAFGQAGATIALPATGAVTGDFCALSFINDSTLSSLTWKELSTSGDDGTGVAFPAGFVLYGQITGFTLATGSVAAYKQV